MGRPDPSGLRAIPFLPGLRRAIIIALVRVGLKPVRTLPVQMLYPGKPGDVLVRRA